VQKSFCFGNFVNSVVCVYLNGGGIGAHKENATHNPYGAAFILII
jgi:hypothetical protein